MRIIDWPLGLLLSLLLAGACDHGESTEVIPIPPGPIGGAPAAAPQVGVPIATGAVPNELMLLAGSKATLTLALRLDKWSEAMAAIRTLIGPALPPQMLALLSLDRPDALISMAGRDAAAMTQIQGIDRTRPILLRMGEAPDDFGAALASALDGAPSPLRHVIVIPATQSAVLRASLTEKATGVCRGVTTSTFNCDGMTLSFFEHGTWVLAALSHTPIASVDELIASPGTEGTLAWALDPSRSMSAHVRVREARGFAMFYAAARLAAARGDTPSRRATGIETILQAFVHMSSFGQEIETFALSLRAAPASLIAVAQLTPTGERRLSLRTNGIAAQVSPSLVTFRSSYDLRSIRNATPDAFTFANAQRPPDVTRPVDRCGPGCILRVLAEPIGYAHTVARIGAEEFDEVLAMQYRSELAPGVIDVEIDMVRVAEEAHDPDLRRMAQSIPRLHLHSAIQGRMWAGAMGHTPNLALDLAVVGASRPEPAPDQRVCFEALAQTTLRAFQSMGRAASEQRSAIIDAAMQAQAVQLGCVTDPLLRAEAQAYVTALQQVAP